MFAYLNNIVWKMCVERLSQMLEQYMHKFFVTFGKITLMAEY